MDAEALDRSPVPHIHRELIHHLSELCRPCDLCLPTHHATNGASR
ncbi:hypothetical protein ABZ252_31040 [Streptomyces sp. NPDC006175]